MIHIMRNNKKELLYSIDALLAGVCWGISTVLCKSIFDHTNMQPTWFVTVKMIISGSIITIYCIFKHKYELILLFNNSKDLLRCILIGIIGALMFQLCCYKTVQISNAATATVLQYFSPIIVMSYGCFLSRKLPQIKECIPVFITIVGIYMISTHGNINSLMINAMVLLYGLGSAVFMALYTIYPSILYKRYLVVTVTGIALLAGGLFSLLIFIPTNTMPDLNLSQLCVLVLIIIIGSVVGYIFYSMAAQNIDKAKVCTFSSAEIPTIIFCQLLFNHAKVDAYDLAGTSLMLTSTLMLSGLVMVRKKKC